MQHGLKRNAGWPIRAGLAFSWVFSWALASLCGATLSAAAQDCAALQYATGVSMTPALPNTMLVPVTINGVAKMMMLDTGGVVSAVTRDTLNEFNLSEYGSPKRLFDMRGNASRTRTYVQAFTLGTLDFPNMALQVSGGPSPAAPFAGELSNDLLEAYDLDLDFGANRLNLFAPAHCDGAGLYWPTRPVAIVPFALFDSHITLPVMLDGRAMAAVVDTGAPYTTLSLRAAENLFHLSPHADLTLLKAGIGGNQSLALYTHTFSVMTFEGVTVTHPAMLVVHAGADPVERQGPWLLPSRETDLPDLIIGMDILRTLHIYIAYREHKLYITRSEPSDAALLPPLAATPTVAAR